MPFFLFIVIDFVDNIITRLNEVKIKVDENENLSSLKELKEIAETCNPTYKHHVEKAIINLLILKGIKELNLNLKHIEFYGNGAVHKIKLD